MRRRLVAGNWKMHSTPAETESFMTRFAPLVRFASAEIAVFPPFTSLDRAGRLLRGSPIGLGAQDVYFETKGAFTGAVSPGMLAACGCRYVLVGHSERRHVFGEDDAVVRRKLDAALAGGLDPVLCVGETLAERRAGGTYDVLETQLTAGLRKLEGTLLSRVVVAYEPVWAIGTGETATPSQAQEACAWIRDWLARTFGPGDVASLRILYGGSVKPDNARSLLTLPDVDGALVGGASLDPDGFAAIVAAAEV
ncbi:MAG: triose-phosphate isomerase [Candidatus Bipolaricaulota bacterium]|nr:triose-phosphate isomerase [Candidatus Bipolaricaulota bacterium]